MAVRKQYLLRIDPELWADVERWAADDLRSANAQVEWILREAVQRRRGPGGRIGLRHPPAGRPSDSSAE